MVQMFCKLCLQPVPVLDWKQHISQKQHLKQLPCKIVVRGTLKNEDVDKVYDYFSKFGVIRGQHVQEEGEKIAIEYRYWDARIYSEVIHKEHIIYDQQLEVSWYKKTGPGPPQHVVHDEKMENEKFVYRKLEIINKIKDIPTFTDQMALFLEEFQQIKSKMNERRKVISDDLTQLLSSNFPYSKIHFFGSSTIDLDIHDSDVNIYLDGTDSEMTTLESIRDLITKSDNFSCEKLETHFVRFRHVQTQIDCELNIKNELPVGKSELIKYYLTLDEKLKPLTLIIKFWADCNELRNQELFSSYSLYILAIFYLQQEPFKLPSVADLQKDLPTDEIDGWNCAFGPVEFSNVPLERATVLELLIGFFKFYANFDYISEVLSPYSGSAIHKTCFVKPFNLPRCYEDYMNQDQIFDINSGICIQEFFEHSRNVLSLISFSAMGTFTAACRNALLVLSDEKEILYKLFLSRYNSVKNEFYIERNVIHDEDEWRKTVKELTVIIMSEILGCELEKIKSEEPDVTYCCKGEYDTWSNRVESLKNKTLSENNVTHEIQVTASIIKDTPQKVTWEMIVELKFERKSLGVVIILKHIKNMDVFLYISDFFHSKLLKFLFDKFPVSKIKSRKPMEVEDNFLDLIVLDDDQAKSEEVSIIKTEQPMEVEDDFIDLTVFEENQSGVKLDKNYSYDIKTEQIVEVEDDSLELIVLDDEVLDHIKLEENVLLQCQNKLNESEPTKEILEGTDPLGDGDYLNQVKSEEYPPSNTNIVENSTREEILKESQEEIIAENTGEGGKGQANVMDFLSVNVGKLLEASKDLPTFAEQITQLENNLRANKSERETIKKNVYDDLTKIFATTHHDHRIYFFGSTSTDLDIMVSNLDIFIENVPVEKMRDLIACSGKFHDLSITLDGVVGKHTKTKMYCKILPLNKLWMKNTQMIEYYSKLDVKVKTLMIFVKYWVFVDCFKWTQSLPSYLIYLLVIFYLQHEPYKVPSVAELQNNIAAEIVNEWNCAFFPVTYRNEALHNASILELVAGFFQFYEKFNYLKYIISVYTGTPIKKENFLKPYDLPHCFENYISRNQDFLVESSFCIQDPFEHSKNVAMPFHLAALCRSLANSSKCLKLIQTGETKLLYNLFHCTNTRNIDCFSVERTGGLDQEKWREVVEKLVLTVCSDILAAKVEKIDGSETKTEYLFQGKQPIWLDRPQTLKEIKSQLSSNCTELDREIAITKHLETLLKDPPYIQGWKMGVILNFNNASKVEIKLVLKRRNRNLFLTYFLRVNFEQFLNEMVVEAANERPSETQEQDKLKKGNYSTVPTVGKSIKETNASHHIQIPVAASKKLTTEQEHREFYNSFRDKVRDIPTFEEQMNLFKNIFKPNTEDLKRNRKIIHDDVISLVRPIYPESRIQMVGSIVSNLCIKIWTDLNISLENVPETVSLEMIRDLFEGSEEFYEVTMIDFYNIVGIKCIHSRTHMICNINFLKNHWVKTTELMGYYSKLNPKVNTLMSFIKCWAFGYSFKGVSHVSGYAIHLMVIFYLQHEPYNLPAVAELQKNIPPNFVDGWNCAFSPVEYSSEALQNASFLDLVTGFFRFYDEFDLSKYVISTYYGAAIERVNFLKPCYLPPCFKRYANGSHDLVVDSMLCIQDPFVHSDNVSSLVDVSTTGRFTALCRASLQLISLGENQLLYNLFCFVQSIRLANHRVITIYKNTEDDLDHWEASVERILLKVCTEVLGVSVTFPIISGPSDVMYEVYGTQNIWENRTTVLKKIMPYLSPDTTELDKEIAITSYILENLTKDGAWNSEIHLTFHENSVDMHFAKKGKMGSPKLYLGHFIRAKFNEFLNGTKIQIVEPSSISRNSPCSKLLPINIQKEPSFANQVAALYRAEGTPQNKEWIDYYMTMDAKLPAFMAVIWRWAKCYKLIATDYFSDYALCLMVIFYLQQEPYNLPPMANLQENTGQNFTSEDLLKVSLLELLAGFFKFYGSFDYFYLVICPYYGRALNKTSFLGPYQLPNCFHDFVKGEILVDSFFCIQDPFNHGPGTSWVSNKYAHYLVQKFTALCRSAFQLISSCGESEVLSQLLKNCEDFPRFEIVKNPEQSEDKFRESIKTNILKILKGIFGSKITNEKIDGDRLIYECMGRINILDLPMKVLKDVQESLPYGTSRIDTIVAATYGSLESRSQESFVWNNIIEIVFEKDPVKAKVLVKKNSHFCFVHFLYTHLLGSFEFEIQDNEENLTDLELDSLREAPTFDEQVATLQNKLQLDIHCQCTLIENDLNSVLAPHYGDDLLIQFLGSSVTGLYRRGSYIHIHIGNVNSDESELNKIKNLICKSPIFLKVALESETTMQFPIVRTIHRETRICCEISIKSKLPVRRSQLIRYYLNTDEKIRTLILTIRFWFDSHQMKDFFCSYALNLMVIFYMQQEPCKLPSVADLQQCGSLDKESGWNCAFTEVEFTNETLKNMVMVELVKNFFKFYGSFDYASDVIAPYFGSSVAKTDFSKPYKPPAAYTDYLCQPQLQELPIDSGICVQDPFEHSKNIVTKYPDPEKFAALCRGAVQIMQQNEKELLYKLLSQHLPVFEFSIEKSEERDENEWMKTVETLMCNTFKRVLGCTDFQVTKSCEGTIYSGKCCYDILDNRTDVSKTLLRQCTWNVGEMEKEIGVTSRIMKGQALKIPWKVIVVTSFQRDPCRMEFIVKGNADLSKLSHFLCSKLMKLLKEEDEERSRSNFSSVAPATKVKKNLQNSTKENMDISFAANSIPIDKDTANSSNSNENLIAPEQALAASEDSVAKSSNVASSLSKPTEKVDSSATDVEVTVTSCFAGDVNIGSSNSASSTLPADATPISETEATSSLIEAIEAVPSSANSMKAGGNNSSKHLIEGLIASEDSVAKSSNVISSLPNSTEKVDSSATDETVTGLFASAAISIAPSVQNVEVTVTSSFTGDVNMGTSNSASNLLPANTNPTSVTEATSSTAEVVTASANSRSDTSVPATTACTVISISASETPSSSAVAVTPPSSTFPSTSSNMNFQNPPHFSMVIRKAKQNILNIIKNISTFGNQISCLFSNLSVSASQSRRKRNVILSDLRKIVLPTFYYSTIDFFGSFATGLNAPCSNLDIHIDSLKPRTKSQKPVLELLKTVLQNSCDFNQVIQFMGLNGPTIGCMHRKLQLSCSITITSKLVVQNTRLIDHYLLLDPKLHQLMLMLKFWSEVQLLKSQDFSHYALHLMVIFYLQRKYDLPAVAHLQKSTSTELIDGWNGTFVSTPFTNTNLKNATITQLVAGFFQFYATFDYISLVISPFFGSPVAKTRFIKPYDLPDCYQQYTTRLQDIELNSGICVQDPFEHSRNVTSKMTISVAGRFTALCRGALPFFNSGEEKLLYKLLIEIQTGPSTGVVFEIENSDDRNDHDWIQTVKTALTTIITNEFCVKITRLEEKKLHEGNNVTFNSNTKMRAVGIHSMSYDCHGMGNLWHPSRVLLTKKALRQLPRGTSATDRESFVSRSIMTNPKLCGKPGKLTINVTFLRNPSSARFTVLMTKPYKFHMAHFIYTKMLKKLKFNVKNCPNSPLPKPKTAATPPSSGNVTLVATVPSVSSVARTSVAVTSVSSSEVTASSTTALRVTTSNNALDCEIVTSTPVVSVCQPFRVLIKGPFTQDNLDQVYNYFSNFGAIKNQKVIKEEEKMAIEYCFQDVKIYCHVIQEEHVLFEQKLKLIPLARLKRNIPNANFKDYRLAVINSVLELSTFEKQITALAENLEKNTHDAENKRKTVVFDLTSALLHKFRDVKMDYYSSDYEKTPLNIDIMKSNFDYSGLKMVEAVRDLIFKSEKFCDVKMIRDDKSYSIMCKHITTQMLCHVRIRNKLWTKVDTLIKYYSTLDNKLKAFFSMVKFWADSYGLIGLNAFSMHSLFLLVIFYLQQEPYKLPLVIQLQKDTPPDIVEGWNCAYAESVEFASPSLKNATFTQLIAGFFRFYATFDYISYAICPYLGSAIAKTEFMKPYNLPQCYKKYMNQNKDLYINSGINIQDPFEHSRNISASVPLNVMGTFTTLCRSALHLMMQGENQLLYKLLLYCEDDNIVKFHGFELKKDEQDEEEWVRSIKSLTHKILSQVLNFKLSQIATFGSNSNFNACVGQCDVWGNRINVLKTLMTETPVSSDTVDKEIAITSRLIKDFPQNVISSAMVELTFKKNPCKVQLSFTKIRGQFKEFHLYHFLYTRLRKFLYKDDGRIATREINTMVESTKCIENLKDITNTTSISEIAKGTSPSGKEVSISDNIESDSAPATRKRQRTKPAEEGEVPDDDEEDDDIPPDFFDDFTKEDFLEGLDVVDACNDDSLETAKKKRRSHERSLSRDRSRSSRQGRRKYSRFNSRSKSRSTSRRRLRSRSRSVGKRARHSKSQDREMKRIGRDKDRSQQQPLASKTENKQNVGRSKRKSSTSVEKKQSTSSNSREFGKSKSPSPYKQKKQRGRYRSRTRPKASDLPSPRKSRKIEEEKKKEQSFLEEIRKKLNEVSTPVTPPPPVKYNTLPIPAVPVSRPLVQASLPALPPPVSTNIPLIPTHVPPPVSTNLPLIPTHVPPPVSSNLPLIPTHIPPPVSTNLPLIPTHVPPPVSTNLPLIPTHVPPPVSTNLPLIPTHVPPPVSTILPLLSTPVPPPIQYFNPGVPSNFYLENIPYNHTFNKGTFPSHFLGTGHLYPIHQPLQIVPPPLLSIIQTPPVPPPPAFQTPPAAQSGGVNTVGEDTSSERQSEDDPVKLFAEKKISLSAFLCINAKPEATDKSTTPELVRKKVNVLSRCQNAIKMMNNERKLTTQLGTKRSLEPENTTQTKYPSPLRLRAAVRFSFTTPSKHEEPDSFTQALNRLLQKLGLWKESDRNDDVKDLVDIVSDALVTSAVVDKNKVADILRVTLLGSSSVANCEHKTKVDIETECEDHYGRCNAYTQVREEVLDFSQGLLNEESIAYFTSAYLLGRDGRSTGSEQLRNPSSDGSSTQGSRFHF